MHMQIHFRISEMTVIQAHRIHMNLRIYQRMLKQRSDIRFAGQITVKHDRLYRQYKGHNIRCIQMTQVHRQSILRPSGRHSVDTNMLTSSLKRKMIYLQRRISRAIGHSTFRQGINRIAKQERTRHEMRIYQRLLVIFGEMCNKSQISSVISCTLRGHHGLQPLSVTKCHIRRQNTLQLTRRQLFPPFR